MSALRVLDELPEGYFVEESLRGVLALHGAVAHTLHEHGYGPESDGDLRRSSLEGRSLLYELRVGDETFLVRRYRHGGLLRRLTGRRFLDAERPFRELILSDALLRQGIRTPRVVAARARSVGLGWELEVMTRRVEGATDLGWVLGMARRGAVPERARRALLAAFGALVRRLHDAGCLHADLQPNNVLVQRSALEGAEPELWLLDLDRSSLGGGMGDGRRRANLARLYRHVSRREEQHGPTLRLGDYARFLRAYDVGRGRWKEDWRAVRQLHARGRAVHRVGWLLERPLAGGRRDPRSLPGEPLRPAPRRGEGG